MCVYNQTLGTAGGNLPHADVSILFTPMKASPVPIHRTPSTPSSVLVLLWKWDHPK